MRSFFICVVSVAVFAALLCIINELLNRPTIYTSWSTKKCDFIEYADGSRADCSMIDPTKKYYHGWSK